MRHKRWWVGSGISWAIGKSFAPCFRQITTPAPRTLKFYRPEALPDMQTTLSKHRRQIHWIICRIFNPRDIGGPHRAACESRYWSSRILRMYSNLEKWWKDSTFKHCLKTVDNWLECCVCFAGEQTAQWRCRCIAGELLTRVPRCRCLQRGTAIWADW